MTEPNPRREELSINQLKFAGYWPPGTEEMVREWLKTKYNPATMPPLEVAEVNGEYHLLGWKAEPGLLEVVRGYPLTDDERAWSEAWSALQEKPARFGTSHTGLRVPGPYGTNEGDKWLAPGSDVQNRLDAEGNGHVLIHEMLRQEDGTLEEGLYVTADPELIAEAQAGHELYVAQRASEN
jgi:hypothetical protein